jgi:hypothetical protein
MKKIKQSCLIVFGVLLMVGCYREEDYKPGADQSKELFEVRINPTTLPADSFSTAQHTTLFDEDIDTTKARATLQTTLGTFVESNAATYVVTPRYHYDSARLLAMAQLRSPSKVGVAVVTVTVGSFSKTVPVTYTRAYPEFSELSANTLSVKPRNNAEGEVVFTNRIIRTQGVPSQGNTVELNVYDTLFRPIGRFRTYSNKSDPSGLTSYTYVLGDSTANGSYYTGKLFAISRAQISDNPADVKRDTVILISTN